MADHRLYPTAELALIPALSRLRGHIGGEYSDSDSLVQEDLFQSSSHISLLCVHGIDLAATATRQFCFHLFHQAALLRIRLVLAQVWRCRYEELFPTLSFRIKFPSIQIPKPKRSVRIKQQGIQRHTHHRLVPAMLLQGLLHVLFKSLVGFLQGRVHLHADDLLPVGRQRFRNVFERNERSQTHQKAAEQQRRRARAPANTLGYTRFRASVIRGLDYGDLFEQPVRFRERSHTGFSILKPLLHHPRRMHAEKDVEDLIGVASKQRPSQDDSALSTSSQRAERISLRGISFQLVDFIRDGVVKEIRHVAADEIHRSEAPDFLPVRLPQRAEQCAP